MPIRKSELYNLTFYSGFAINFFMGFLFTNNALLPLFVKEAGGGSREIGLFLTVFAITSCFCRPLVGGLVERLGVRPVMLFGILFTTLPCLGFMWSMHTGLPLWVWALRALQGFGFGGYVTGFFTMAAQVAPPGRKNEAVAMYGMSGLAANMAGPVTGEMVIQHYGFEGFFLMYAAIGVVAAFVVFIMPLHDLPLPSGKFGLKGFAVIIRMPEFLFVFFLAMLHASCYATISSFIAPVAHERSVASFTLFFSAFALSGIFSRVGGSHWGDRLGSVWMLIPGFLIYGIGLTILQCSWHVFGFIIAGGLCGFAHGISYPALTSLGYILAPPAYRGTGVAMVTGMMDAGSAFAALLLGVIGNYSGYGILFGLEAIAPFLAFFLVFFFGKKIIPISTESRNESW